MKHLKFGIVTHGGVGSPTEWSDGCRQAAERGLDLLRKGKTALEAVVEAAVCLENDGRYNAGRGSALRLDGQTMESDAALMDSHTHVGIAINVQNVPHPILLARRIMDTPHLALAGRGAENLAQRYGLYAPFAPSPQALEHYQTLIQQLKNKTLREARATWNEIDIESLWNFERNDSESFPCDTIGAVALDQAGTLAVANSTGGASPMLLGRVGDSPMPGCGFYCGPAAAVAATGIGEEIVKRLLSFSIYQRLAQGDVPAQVILEQELKAFTPDIPVGVITITQQGYAIAANRPMASHSLVVE